MLFDSPFGQSDLRPDHDKESKDRLRRVLANIVDTFGESEEDVRDIHGNVNGDSDVGKLVAARLTLAGMYRSRVAHKLTVSR